VGLGPKAPRQADDLSERIAAGFRHLRALNLPHASQRLAEALNRYKIPCKFRDGRSSLWTSDEVLTRVKQYEKQAISEATDREAERQRIRQQLVDKWRSFYYPNPAWELPQFPLGTW
jgi:hypothetical protein